jgi:aquaporin related protein
MAVTSAPDSGPNGGYSNQTVVFIALSYGFSLLIAVWMLFRVSGGLFNPAVTLGMVITGTLPVVRGLIFLPVQLLGGI